MAMHTALASGAFPEGSLPDGVRNELLGRWLLRGVTAALARGNGDTSLEEQVELGARARGEEASGKARLG